MGELTRVVRFHLSKILNKLWRRSEYSELCLICVQLFPIWPFSWLLIDLFLSFLIECSVRYFSWILKAKERVLYICFSGMRRVCSEELVLLMIYISIYIILSFCFPK